MKKKLTYFAMALAFALSVQAQTIPVYLDDTKPIEERIEDALDRKSVV